MILFTAFFLSMAVAARHVKNMSETIYSVI